MLSPVPNTCASEPFERRDPARGVLARELGDVGTQSVPAPVLELDEGPVAARREPDFHLGGGSFGERRVPGEHEPPWWIPLQDLAPGQDLTVAQVLEHVAPHPGLELYALHLDVLALEVARGARMRLDRPPGTDLLGEDAERPLDIASNGDRAGDRFDAHPFAPFLFPLARFPFARLPFAPGSTASLPSAASLKATRAVSQNPSR